MNSIAEWQETFSALPDDKFFEIIRLYLGEVKTPYNKQRLIEQLAGFIRNENNMANMFSLLDTFDIKILTAIHFIPNATLNMLVDFFAGDYSIGEIYAEISNLTLRLFIYSDGDKYSDKKYLHINPLVWDKLEPYIRINNILTEEQIVSYSMDDVFYLSPNFLLAFISFINMNGCSCKNDGSIKKNDLNRLQNIFPSKINSVQLLLSAFINLNLVISGEKSYEIDLQRFKQFANLKSEEQYALLCAASGSRFSREGLKKEAQLFLDCIASIPEAGYSRSTIVKLAYLVGTHNPEGTGTKSRFSKMIESARADKSLLNLDQVGSIIDRMIDFAIEFGLLLKKGINEDGKEVYIPGPAITSNFENQFEQPPKVINIESTFTVMIMPGLSLKDLLPLSAFLSIKNQGIVSEYEITRQSVSFAFDRGWNPEAIIELLEKYTSYKLPQNLVISISDWYNSYTSAMIYHGYILKVSKENIQFAENNPNIRKYIKEKLAEGIYLLNVPVDADISSFINESGLEFMGKINNPVNQGERLPFPLLRSGQPLTISSEKEPVQIKFSQAGEILSNLKACLDTMSLNENQKETLLNKIRQRVILTENQLKTTSVQIEILEADGMDFSGKIHLFEAAIKEGDMMEVTLPQYNNPDQYFTVVGKPLGITKQYADAIVRFEALPLHDVENLVVSRITHVRRLRY